MKHEVGENKIKIRHILADGTEVESIEGRVIPPTGRTEAVYRLLADFIIKYRQKEREKAEQKDGEE